MLNPLTPSGGSSGRAPFIPRGASRSSSRGDRALDRREDEPGGTSVQIAHAALGRDRVSRIHRNRESLEQGHKHLACPRAPETEWLEGELCQNATHRVPELQGDAVVCGTHKAILDGEQEIQVLPRLELRIEDPRQQL